MKERESIIKSHWRTATALVTGYDGDQPFSRYLKEFFGANRKFGSRDRKQVSHLCYCYFRLGKATAAMPVEQGILAGLFLCSTDPDPSLAVLAPEWSSLVTLPLTTKAALAGIDPAAILPWRDELSDNVDADQFAASFLVQPDLFLRVRPGFEERVPAKLGTAGIAFRQLSDTCIALPNQTRLEKVLDLDREAVIQDYGSQQTVTFFANYKPQTTNHKLSVWDCCAASGGKSILAWDLLGPLDLTVSDIRESILANLRARFQHAGINNYRGFVADLADKAVPLPAALYDLVIADVPCTGSGTWSRTPEQLWSFHRESIDAYAARQHQILSRLPEYIRPGGYLLYITCSVFRKENEDQVTSLERLFGLKTLRMQLLSGMTQKADSMFVALLQRPIA